MSLIALRPKNGREVHYFENEGDGLSVCGRAPKPKFWAERTDITVSCKHCLRAFELVTRNAVPGPAPLFTDLPADRRKKKARIPTVRKNGRSASSSIKALPKKRKSSANGSISKRPKATASKSKGSKRTGVKSTRKHST